MAQNRIAALRREAGLNQKELGQKLGVGQTTVSAWEIGRNEPDSAALNRMAQLFQVSIGYLAGYEKDNGRRGLSESEYQAAQRANFEKAEQRKFEREIKRQQMPGMTEEELEEILQSELMHEWLESGRNCYLETYQIEKYFEYLSEEQRQRAVKIIELAFPNVTRSAYASDESEPQT